MSSEIILTTGDLKQDYHVIGPVYYQISNRGGGLFTSSLFEQLVTKYTSQLNKMKKSGTVSANEKGTSLDVMRGFFGEAFVAPSKFEMAFYIASEELKLRASLMKADAIICMRQDIDLDTTGFQYFYLQMFGTAVRFE
jgi:uncharacterized protein YbjQ (UPF0145 family)